MRTIILTIRNHIANNNDYQNARILVLIGIPKALTPRCLSIAIANTNLLREKWSRPPNFTEIDRAWSLLSPRLADFPKYDYIKIWRIPTGSGMPPWMVQTVRNVRKPVCKSVRVPQPHCDTTWEHMQVRGRVCFYDNLGLRPLVMWSHVNRTIAKLWKFQPSRWNVDNEKLSPFGIFLLREYVSRRTETPFYRRLLCEMSLKVEIIEELSDFLIIWIFYNLS